MESTNRKEIENEIAAVFEAYDKAMYNLMRKSPEHGNAVMDWIGDEEYCRILKLFKEEN